MSCCAEKTGLASLAEHPGIILFAYLCALLPLAAIYALDFINRDWKTIRETRRGGVIHLIFSLPPLAAVVFYIHLQRVAQDYKEMATAITAAILCILHVLRTIWGLIQLHAFKQWNTHALLVLTRIGFKVPKHIQRKDEKRASKVVGIRISNYWSMVLNCIRKVFKLQKVHKFAQRVLPVSFRNNRDERRTEVSRLVDKYMTVNSSLVDNEFFGAELPCGPNFSLLRNPFRKKISPVSKVLTSGKAEEGVVRWTAAFLACFGTQWLIHTRKLAFFDTRSRADEDENLGGKDLPGRLLCFISFCITHSVHMNFGEGGPYFQEVSILSPLHVMCSSLFEPWVSTLKVTEKNALPHQLRGKSKIRSIELGEYAISLQNFISKWPKDSLHEMEEQEKHAVLNISPHQIAFLNKLMEERDSHVFQLGPEFRSHWKGEKLKTLLWQVGYHVDQSRVDIDKWRETMEVFPGVFPTIRESFLELQASIHVDNWVALETGYFPLTYGDVQDEVSEVEESQWGQMFGAQKKLELRRLQLELATKPRTQIYSQVKFLGYVMDFVRRSLSRGRFIVDATRGKWNPQICNERTDIFCSDQLIEALQEANSENTNEADGEGNKLDRKSLQMRVLWEIQGALMKKDRVLPSDYSLMMLCMLGYPSLRISKPTDCQDEHIAPSPRNEDVAIPVDPDSESSRTQEVAPQAMRKAHSTKNCRNLKYACVRIDIVEAPQPLHIFFRLNYLSNVAEIWIRSNEDQEVTRFCWQSWKDGFMGRLCAQSEWRSTRMHSRNEILRKEAIVSQFTEEPESGWKWGGWPPFLIEVHSDPKMDRMSEVRIEESVASEELLVVVQENSSGTSCQCGCKEHELFLSAKEMSDKGQEKQAFELFRTCIIDHMHYPSLRHCVYNAIKQFPKNEEHMGKLLEIMYARIGRARTGGIENLCRKFRQYDLEDLVALFGAVYDNCHIQDALFCKSQAALLRSLDGDAGIDRCIENLESLVLKDPSAYYSRNVLAQCFFRKYCSTGHRMDEVLGMKYFMRFDSVYMEEAVDRAFVIEKGSLSRREYARLNALPREVSTLLPISGRFIGEHKIAEFIFLWSSNPAHRISKNAKTAFAIYSRVILEKNRYFSAMYKKMAANRLAMMYHRGVDGVDKEHTKAETLYEEAIGDDERFSQINMLQHTDVQSINAMCNLAVMHSQRNDNQQSAEKSVKLFEKSIRYVEKKSWQIGPMGRHSTSMNNLAVFMESGKLVQKDIQYAKELYRRAYEINENPIAIYNLAVLLKWEDPSPQNLEEAEKLFSTVADLGADLQSMPVVASQLEKAQGLAATEISRVLPVELEEIDDCLAYVKMVHSSPESFYL